MSLALVACAQPMGPLRCRSNVRAAPLVGDASTVEVTADPNTPYGCPGVHGVDLTYAPSCQRGTKEVCARDACMSLPAGPYDIMRFPVMQRDFASASLGTEGVALVSCIGVSFEMREHCRQRGMHVCTGAEWERAFRGNSNYVYLLGDARWPECGGEGEAPNEPFTPESPFGVVGVRSYVELVDGPDADYRTCKALEEVNCSCEDDGRQLYEAEQRSATEALFARARGADFDFDAGCVFRCCKCGPDTYPGLLGSLWTPCRFEESPP